jgi:hypothetical protein
VKDTPLHFIVYRSSQKKIISREVVKRLTQPTTLHPHPYTISWLSQGKDIYINQQCFLHYDIKPFKEEVLFDVSPLEFCDVLIGQPYMWKHLVVYESRPHNVNITLRYQLYRVSKAFPTTAISLISTKHFIKVVS